MPKMIVPFSLMSRPRSRSQSRSGPKSLRASWSGSRSGPKSRSWSGEFKFKLRDKQLRKEFEVTFISKTYE